MVSFKKIVEETLNKFPEVKWDRWAGNISSGDGIGVGVFGWIPRPDGKSDFVYVRIDKDGIWLMATSSAKYSAEFSKRIGCQGHHDCKRVRELFPTINCV